MPDQLRFDSVGIFGNYIIQTPNIDAFAGEAVRFTNIFQQAPTCSQSRSSMFTGQYPHVAGHRTLQNLLKPWEPNVFRSLREGGYHVASLSPRGDLFAENATELSFDENGFLNQQTLPKFSYPSWNKDQDDIWNRLFYLGKRNATQAIDYDAVTVAGALKWLEAPPQEPWVLFIPLQFPHPPFTVEEPWFSMYKRDEMPIPAAREDKTGYSPNFMTRLPDEQGSRKATTEQWQVIAATYYGMISRVDHQFGQIVNKTKSCGLWDSTVTMFFTDHGEFLGDYGLVEKWPSGVSENLVHEPLLIGGAGLPEGKVYDEMAEMVDLVPTMLQLGSVAETYKHYGLSLVDAMHSTVNNATISHKDYAYTEGGFLIDDEPLLEQGPFPYDIKGALQHDDPSLLGMTLGVRDKNYTYVYRLYEPDELYDRVNDIQELHNLAAESAYAEVVARMRQVALQWFLATPGTIPWYKDDRKPKDTLESPYEQYKQRVEQGDCKGYGCRGKLQKLR
ncbi:sulfatase [Phaeosphaeria sp. MPI-PUGE-AT-0046c]|nr:sulfatase [Phaeosphaeria sp. MPI-PUGE-AT-0046c]